MRIQSLTIRGQAPKQPELSHQQMRQWFQATEEARAAQQGPWTWSAMTDDLLVSAVEALVQDFQGNELGLHKVITGLLLCRPEHDREWSWSIPLTQGGAVSFEGAIRHAAPTEEDQPKVAMDLVAESDEDVRRMKAMGLLNGSATATVPMSDVSDVLDEVRAVDRPAPPSVRDLDASELAAQVRRVALEWPQEDRLCQILMVAGPLVLWQRGCAMNASDSCNTLRDLTFEGVSYGPDVVSVMDVRMSQPKPTRRVSMAM